MLLLCIQTNRSGTRPLLIQLYFVLVEIRLHIQIIKSCTILGPIKLAQLKITDLGYKKRKERKKRTKIACNFSCFFRFFQLSNLSPEKRELVQWLY